MHVKMQKIISLAFTSLLGTRKHRKIIIKSRLDMKKFSSALTSSIKFSTSYFRLYLTKNEGNGFQKLYTFFHLFFSLIKP